MNTRPAAALLLDRHTQSSDLPLKWDEKKAVWKTPVHDRGWSSPVIEEGRVYLKCEGYPHLFLFTARC